MNSKIFYKNSINEKYKIQQSEFKDIIKLIKMNILIY